MSEYADIHQNEYSLIFCLSLPFSVYLYPANTPGISKTLPSLGKAC